MASRSCLAATPSALPAPPILLDDLSCNLCGEPMAPHEFSQAVRDATNMDICTHCLEVMVDASAIEPRAEVGMVGGGH